MASSSLPSIFESKEEASQRGIPISLHAQHSSMPDRHSIRPKIEFGKEANIPTSDVPKTSPMIILKIPSTITDSPLLAPNLYCPARPPELGVEEEDGDEYIFQDLRFLHLLFTRGNRAWRQTTFPQCSLDPQKRRRM